MNILPMILAAILFSEGASITGMALSDYEQRTDGDENADSRLARLVVINDAVGDSSAGSGAGIASTHQDITRVIVSRESSDETVWIRVEFGTPVVRQSSITHSDATRIFIEIDELGEGSRSAGYLSTYDSKSAEVLGDPMIGIERDIGIQTTSSDVDTARAWSSDGATLSVPIVYDQQSVTAVLPGSMFKSGFEYALAAVAGDAMGDSDAAIMLPGYSFVLPRAISSASSFTTVRGGPR